MSFDAAAMLAGLYATPGAEPAGVSPQSPEPPSPVVVDELPLASLPSPVDPDCDEANDWHWQQIDDVDRDYLLGPRNWPAPCAWCGGRLAHRLACAELRRECIPVIPFGKHRGRRVDALPRDYIGWVLGRGIGSDGFRNELQRWRSKDSPP